jgi:hypothetical protein
MVLTQRGGEVTGSVVVDDKDWPITEGSSEAGGRLRFRVSVPGDTVQFDLTVTGDHMTGKATSAKESGPGNVEVDLTRKVPARAAVDTTGVWSGTMSGKGESLPITIEFQQKGNDIAGVATVKGRSAAIQGEMDGAKLTFRAEQGSEKVRFVVIVTPDNMSGFAAVEGHDKETVVDVELTRTAKAAGAGNGGASGQWIGTAAVNERGTEKHYTVRFRLAQSGTSLSGALVNEEGAEFPLRSGSVDGNRVEFEMDAKGEHVRFRLQIDGDRLTGESTQSRGGAETSSRISAVRRSE